MRFFKKKPRQPAKHEPFDSTAMLKDMMDTLKVHFWRDQRVEITKLLLRRDGQGLRSAKQLVDQADQIIQELKSCGD